MMLENLAAISASFGARPLFEGDLILVIGDEETTRRRPLRRRPGTSRPCRPFIELPDLMYVEGEPMTGKMLTAMGVAPRMGVLGTPVAVEDRTPC